MGTERLSPVGNSGLYSLLSVRTSDLRAVHSSNHLVVIFIEYSIEQICRVWYWYSNSVYNMLVIG